MVNISYFQYHHPDNPVNLPVVDIEPTRVYDDIDSSTVTYGKCPAWSHKMLREFTVYAPKDFKEELLGYLVEIKSSNPLFKSILLALDSSPL